MIKVENLSLIFDKKEFFKDINITFVENKFNIVTGLNGTGKTTLFKILTKTLKSNSGIVQTGEKKVFYLPQEVKYPNGITLFEYLSSVFYSNWKWRLNKSEKTKISEVLELLELSEKKKVFIENLSSGEKQKANIAIGVLSGANLLLLDEPISNLDITNQIRIMNILKKLTLSDITIVAILHDLNLASSYGDYFVGITPGKNIIKGDKEEFFTSEKLYEIYNVYLKVIKNEEDFIIQLF